MYNSNNSGVYFEVISTRSTYSLQDTHLKSDSATLLNST